MIYVIVNESYDGAIRSTDILYVTAIEQVAKNEFNFLKGKEPNHRLTLDVYILYEFPDMAYTTKRSYPTPDMEEYIKEIYDNSYQYEDD